VEHGADINRASQKGETPLLKACEIGNEAIVKCLVEHGAYVNKADYHGYTPSFCVCESGNEDLVIYLVELGTDINNAYNNIEMVELLLDYATNNNIKLELKESMLDSTILVFHKKRKGLIKSISEIKTDIIWLLDINRNNNRLNIVFNTKDNILDSNKSPLFKLFERERLEREKIVKERIEKEKLESKKTNIKNNDLSTPYEKKSDENGDLAVVLYDFNGFNTNELNIRKNEYIIVTNWNIKEGWAYGYKNDDPQKKGIFPVPLVSKGLILIIFYFNL